MTRIPHLCFAAAICLLGSLPGARAPGPDSAFVDDRYGLSIVPPRFADDGEAKIVTIATFQAPPSEGFSANLNIQRQTFDGDMKAYAALSENQFRMVKLEVLSSKPTQVGKREAHEWTYAGTMSGNSLKFHALAIEDGDHVVLVTGTALAKEFAEHAAAFDAALASLKFED